MTHLALHKAIVHWHINYCISEIYRYIYYLVIYWKSVASAWSVSNSLLLFLFLNFHSLVYIIYIYIQKMMLKFKMHCHFLTPVTALSVIKAPVWWSKDLFNASVSFTGGIKKSKHSLNSRSKLEDISFIIFLKLSCDFEKMGQGHQNQHQHLQLNGS